MRGGHTRAASAKCASSKRPSANSETGSPKATRYSTIAGRNRERQETATGASRKGIGSLPMCKPLLRAFQESLLLPSLGAPIVARAIGRTSVAYSDPDVTAGAKREHLVPTSQQDRRDTYVFIGFLVLCGTTVGIIAIAKGAWKAGQWAAFGAIAAFIQAIAVLGALALAGQQIRQMRSSDARRRREELIDRLDLAWVHLDRSLSEATAAWRMVVFIAREFLQGLEEITPEVRARRRTLYREEDARFTRARTELGTRWDDVLRLLLALGLHEHRLSLSLRTASMFGPWFAPSDPDELTEEDASENYDRPRKAVTDLRTLINDLLKETAPSRFE